MSLQPIEGLAKLADLDPLSDKAYAAIKRAILSLRLPPGTALVERSLAEQLGVSKTPVRRALVLLEREGLVTMQPYRGTVVAPVSVDDVREIIELREVLEGLAARKAAGAASPAELEAIGRTLDGAEEAHRGGLHDECSRLGHGLHVLLLGKSENRRLRAILANLEDQLQRFRLVSARIPGRLARSNAEHRAILAALEAGDGALAERSMREHLHGVLADLMAGETLT